MYPGFGDFLFFILYYWLNLSSNYWLVLRIYKLFERKDLICYWDCFYFERSTIPLIFVLFFKNCKYIFLYWALLLIMHYGLSSLMASIHESVVVYFESKFVLFVFSNICFISVIILLFLSFTFTKIFFLLLKLVYEYKSKLIFYFCWIMDNYEIEKT